MKNINCENCETPLQGEFCHKCGQKDIDTNFGFFKLLGFLFTEFINWDNKVLRTFKCLLFKPGFLSKKYHEGKRAAYMNPLKLYFFTSFFFFTLLFINYKSPQEKEVRIHKNSISKIDSATTNNSVKTQNNLNKPKNDSDNVNVKISANGILINLDSNDLEDGFFKSFLTFLESKDNGFINGKLLSYLPKFMFFILPFIAVFLSLFYRRQKQFYFYNHFVYISHNHSFLFASYFSTILIAEVILNVSDDVSGYIYFLLFAYIVFYLFASLKVFYTQSWKKTTLKFILIFLSYLLLSIISLLVLLLLIYLLN